MRFTGRLLVLVALAALVVAAVAAVGGAGTARGVSAGAQIRPLAGRDEAGVAYFELKAQRLSYWVVVYNLDPGSTHAAHIHGPRGNCTTRPANVVVPFPDLTANANGVAVASGRISLRQADYKQVLRRGFYFNVHVSSTADGVGEGITCGNIRFAR
jgi:hypothetical protein